MKVFLGCFLICFFCSVVTLQISDDSNLWLDQAQNETTEAPQNNNCLSKNECKECSKSSNCVWCQTNKLCLDGQILGPKKGFNYCRDWRWKQCSVSGKYLLFVGAGLVGLILLCCCCLILCCCCRRKSKKVNNFAEFKTLSIHDEEQEHLLSSQHPRTDARRAELRKKYGAENISEKSDV